MRLRYKKEINRSELEKLKHKIGDIVIFENAKYIVTQVGLRWVYATPINNPNIAPSMLYIKNISKWEEPGPDPEENDPKYNIDGEFK